MQSENHEYHGKQLIVYLNQEMITIDHERIS